MVWGRVEQCHSVQRIGGGMVSLVTGLRSHSVTLAYEIRQLQFCLITHAAIFACENACSCKCQNYLPYFVKLIRQLICTLVCPHRTKLLL